MTGLQKLEHCDRGGEVLHLQQDDHKPVAEQHQNLTPLKSLEALTVQQSDNS